MLAVDPRDLESRALLVDAVFDLDRMGSMVLCRLLGRF